MTETRTPDPERHDGERDLVPEPAVMPKWVPVLIGAILVVLAGFAVFTGLHYRDDNTLESHLRPHRQAPRRNAPAPPGEPGAGVSFVLPGSSGENTPTASAPVKGQSRTVIMGGPGGVHATARLWARRGMVLNVLPDDAMVYVNDLPVGIVRQFNAMDEVYDFAEAGSYTVRIVTPAGAEKTFIVTASDDAQQDIARISAKF